MNQSVLEAKQAVVAEICEKAKASGSITIVEYRGLSVSKIEELRRALRAEGAELTVYKNSLAERAVKELGYEGGDEAFAGPNAIVFSKELSNGPKVINKYTKKFGGVLAVKGGYVEGKFVDDKGMVAVAKMPGREGLISMFLSCLQAPVRQFACAVQAVADKQ